MEQAIDLLMMKNLEEKKECLQSILLVLEIQNEILFMAEEDITKFEQCMNHKDQLLRTLEQICNHLDIVLATREEEVREYFLKNRNEALVLKNKKNDLDILQKEIDRLEKECKCNLDEFIRQERKKIKSFRISNQTASSYYRNMNKYQIEESFFMDNKK